MSASSRKLALLKDASGQGKQTTSDSSNGKQT